MLHGTGDEQIEFRYVTDGSGRKRTRKQHAFEGILPNLERRYRETESPRCARSSAKYLSTQPCPDCDGTRLERAARNVFVADRSAARRSRT